MTDDETQQAVDQQTPVMRSSWPQRGRGDWRGPFMVRHEAQRRSASPRMWVLSAGQWVYSANLRPATPHELLTAEESG